MRHTSNFKFLFLLTASMAAVEVSLPLFDWLSNVYESRVLWWNFFSFYEYQDGYTRVNCLHRLVKQMAAVVSTCYNDT